MQYVMSAVNDGLQILADLIDAGSGPGLLRFYGGQPPAPDDPPTGDLLAECELSDPCGNVADAALTFGPIADGVGLVTGNPTYAQIVDSDGLFVMQGTVSASIHSTVAPTDFLLSAADTTIYETQPVVVTSLIIDRSGQTAQIV